MFCYSACMSVKRGDPKGHRIARRQAMRLAEAASVAHLLKVLLDRADYDSEVCRTLIKDLGGYENSQWVKSLGQVEPRRRFKKRSSQPMQEERQTNLLFVDESGKSKPEPLAIPTYFSLGAIAIAPDAAEAYRKEADKLKIDFFGRTDFTFHEPYMRNHNEIYSFGGDDAKRRDFDDAIANLVETTRFTAFGVGVIKQAYEEFVASDADPYLPTDVYGLAIELLMERYVDYLAFSSEEVMGRVTFESQGPKEDAEHQLGYAKLLLDGTQWVSESDFRNWLEIGLRFIPKSGSHPMELADMFSRDLFEWVRSGCDSSPRRWELFQDKIYCRDDGMRGKFGVKIFPDSDIRDIIEAHRTQCGAIREN